MNFGNSYLKYVNHLEQINEAAREAPAQMVEEVELSYRHQINGVVERMLYERRGCRILLLAGPSGSGKTTTAHRLVEAIEAHGLNAELISLDDFYRGENQAPLTEDGRYDYESVDALNLEQIEKSFLDLAHTGECDVPRYSFALRSPEEKMRHISVGERGIAVVEGLHALNPKISGHLPKNQLFRVYVSVKQGIKDHSGMVLDARELRFLRRLVRDYHFRKTDAERTVAMWPDVLRGEDRYIQPFKKSSDVTINSIHIYEPCVIRAHAVPLLEGYLARNPDGNADLERYLRALRRFEPISEELIPQESIIREFVGGGAYEG